MTNVVTFDAEAIQPSIDVLRRGGLVAIPTETVYGLAADATHGAGVAAIFAAKGRPSFNPLIAHVCAIEMAQRYVAFDPQSLALAEHFWPGPLTLVLPLRENSGIHPLVTAGLSTLAVRMPRGPISVIITELGHPLAAPSANISGKISATSAEAVRGDLGSKVDLILDAGACAVGLESTIVKIDGERALLLRPGGLAAEEIEQFLGQKLERMDQRAAIQAPGMMALHYAPEASMRLNVHQVEPGEALLAFGRSRALGASDAVAMLNLSENGDLREAAVNLFGYMKQLDSVGAQMIAVEPIPLNGLGEAINDRLTRAATPRDNKD